MKRKKLYIGVILALSLLIVLYVALFGDASLNVHYSGRWFSFARSTYYRYDPEGRNPTIGRKFTIGPIAIDYFYADVTIVTNVTSTNH